MFSALSSSPLSSYIIVDWVEILVDNKLFLKNTEFWHYILFYSLLVSLSESLLRHNQILTKRAVDDFTKVMIIRDSIYINKNRSYDTKTLSIYVWKNFAYEFANITQLTNRKVIIFFSILTRMD